MSEESSQRTHHWVWKSHAAHAQGLGLGVVVGSAAVFYLNMPQGLLTMISGVLILAGFLLDRKAGGVRNGA